jgi:hypothetical protein
LKQNTTSAITAFPLLVALVLPIQLAAQHTRYKLVDIGTFGGYQLNNIASSPSDAQRHRGCMACPTGTVVFHSGCRNPKD